LQHTPVYIYIIYHMSYVIYHNLIIIYIYICICHISCFYKKKKHILNIHYNDISKLGTFRAWKPVRHSKHSVHAGPPFAKNTTVFRLKRGGNPAVKNLGFMGMYHGIMEYHGYTIVTMGCKNMMFCDCD
jgi:hypothetical protein